MVKNRKRKILLIATVVLPAAVIWLLVANHYSTSMPVYQGKTAGEWMRGVGATTKAFEAFNAFKAMGSNVVPFLVHELERKESALEKFSRWINPYLPSLLRNHVSPRMSETERWSIAAIGLKYANSRTAIPPLTNLLAHASQERQGYILVALEHFLGPEDTNCIPVLRNCLRSKDVYICVGAIEILKRMNAEKPALPTLTNFIASTNWEERLYALDCLSHLDALNSNKWQAMLTNDPDWIAEQRVPRPVEASTNTP